MIYGTESTQALFTGLATQIVYGGCDHDTADFYSKASGTTTADANPDPQKANFRQRPLLTVDEVVTPQIGNCTIFARFVEPAFATQIILTARLTRLYEREDWQCRFAASKNEEPLLLERDVSVNVPPTFAQPEPPKPSRKDNTDSFAQAAKQRMAEAKTGKAKASDGAKPTMTDIRSMKRRAEQQRQTAKTQMGAKMSLDKNKTIAEVGRRTRLRNHDVQKMLEALIEVWSEELADCGRIELENFLVLQVKNIDRGDQAGVLVVGGRPQHAPRLIRKLTVRPSKSLKARYKTNSTRVK